MPRLGPTGDPVVAEEEEAMLQGPMEMLEAEHRVIQRVVGAMVRLEAALLERTAIPA
jgi:hypothetical protein